MILVDSSVWIAQLRGDQANATVKLEAVAEREPLGRRGAPEDQ